MLFLSNHYANAPILTSVATFLLAVFVFSKNIKGKINRIFAFYYFSISLWSFSQGFLFIAQGPEDKMSALFWARLLHYGVFFIPTLFIHFVLIFLDEVKQKKKILILAYVITLFLVIICPTKLFIKDMVPKFSFRYIVEPGFFYSLCLLFFIGFVAYGLYKLFKAYHNFSGIKANQTKYLFWGSLFGYLGGSLNFLWVFNMRLYPLNPFGIYTVPFYVFMVAYGIVRYRLMDINLVFTRAGIFAIVYTLVLGLPFWFGFNTGKWIYSTIIMAFLATLGPFIYQYLRKRAEDVLLREEHYYQSALKELAKTLTLIKNMDKLLETISSELYKLIKVPVGIYLIDKEDNVYILKYSYPKDFNLSPNTPANSLTLVLLKNNKRSLFSEELKFDSNLSNKDIGLVIPCFVKDKLLGFIVLGQKQNNRVYSQLDSDIFKIFASYLSLAIENLNYLKELEELHKQLIEKERLISASEISEAYSHELGNIINNISMASTTLGFEDYSKEEVKNVYEAIKRNVKRAKDIFKAVESYEAKVKTEFKQINLNEILKIRLDGFKEKIKNFKINLKEDFLFNQTIMFNANENVSFVFDYILDAAITSMQDTPQKELFVSIKLTPARQAPRLGLGESECVQSNFEEE